MILGSSDFTGNFIIVDGATAPLVSIASGADYMAISMDKAADQVNDLNKSILTLANALPVVTGNLTMFAGAAALAKREVKSLNAELAKTLGLLSGLSVMSSTGIAGGGALTGSTRKKRPVLDINIAGKEVFQHRVTGEPRFTKTGALGYYKEHPVISSLSTKKIGALLNHPEIETQRSIARKMAAGLSYAEAEKVIRRDYTDDWWTKHRHNMLLSKPVKQLIPVKPVSKKDILGSSVTPYYVREAIENAVFREIESKEKVPDAGRTIKQLQKYFDSVGAGSFTAPDEDLIKKRYAREGLLMRSISSVVNEYMDTQGTRSGYYPGLNRRLFRAFTEGEEGLKLSRIEKNILETLKGDKKLLRQFSGPASGISWRIGEDRGFRIKDLAVMSRIPAHEMAAMSDMLNPEEFDNWVAEQYYLRNPLGLTKTKNMKTTWRTGDREMIYPVRNWQRDVLKSLNKQQLTQLTNIKKGKWTEKALSKEALRRIRKGIPLHFDELFDKHPDLLPETDLLPDRIAPFVSDKDAGLRRMFRRTPYQHTLRDIAAGQRLPKTVSQWRAKVMKNAINSLVSDFERYGAFPSDLEIKKRHARSFMRDKIQKKLVRTQFWDALQSPLFSEGFAGRSLTEPAPVRANQKRYFDWLNKQRAWETHLGSLRAGRGLPKDYYLEQYRNKQSLFAPLKAWQEYNQKMKELRNSLKILPAPVDPFKTFEQSMLRIGTKYTPANIRLGVFEEAFTDLGMSFSEAARASAMVEQQFRGMGDSAVPPRRAAKAFSDTLKKMGGNSRTVTAGAHYLEQQIKRLDDPLHRAAFGSSFLNTRLGRLGHGFTNAGNKARNFGILSALALNEPVLFMGAMLGLMPPLIGGFAALAAAALGLAGAFALLGLGGAMAWGDKLKNSTDRVSDLNEELGVASGSTAGKVDRMSYSVKGLTSDIGGLALVMNEFKKAIGPVFKEFGKPWVPFMETLPGSFARAFRKIFSAIAPFSEMVQHDARAVGGWFTDLAAGFMHYSLSLLRNPEIRSAFRTILDIIPKYGKKGMDFIVNAFLENKGTIREFGKSMIEILPPFLTATTAFFRAIVPVITKLVKLAKSFVTALGLGDEERGAKFAGYLAGGLAFAGILSKLIGLAGTLVGKFIHLKEIWQVLKTEQFAAAIAGSGGIAGGKTVPAGGKSAPTGKLPTILAGGGTILSRLTPLAILAYMGYVAHDAYTQKQTFENAYKTDPKVRLAVDRAVLSEHKNIANARLNPFNWNPPDISDYFKTKTPDLSNLQDYSRFSGINPDLAGMQNINVTIYADDGFRAGIERTTSGSIAKDVKVINKT